MAKKAETTFKEKVLFDLRALPLTWAVKTQQVAVRGIPDILACVAGNFVAIELKKSEKDKPNALQNYNLAKIALARGFPFTASPSTWSRIYETLKFISGKGDDMPKKKSKSVKKKKSLAKGRRKR